MNKKLSISLLLMLLLACYTQAQTQPSTKLPDSLLASGYNDEYWIASVRYESAAFQKAGYITHILKRTDPVGGLWEEYGRIQIRTTQIVAFQDGLAMLDDVGHWKLLRTKDVAPDGISIPAGYEISTFASDGKSLYALALPANSKAVATATNPTTRPTAPGIFVLNGNRWDYFSHIPSIEYSRSVSLDAVMGKLFIAYYASKAIQVEAYEQGQWRPLGKVDSDDTFKLVHNSPYPLLGLQNAEGKWSISRIINGSPITPLDGDKTSDLTMVGASLRVSWWNTKEELQQISYQDYGLGKKLGPDVIGQLPVPEQVHDAWKQMGLMIMLTIATLFIMRKKSDNNPIVLERQGLVLAPLARRMAAGTIDLLPVIIAVYLTIFRRHEGPLFRNEQDFLFTAGMIFISFLFYIAHTMIGEILFTRTIGKLIFGLYVVTTEGAKPQMSSLFVRNLLRVIDAGLLVPWMLMLYPPYQMRVGDMAAKTLVVSKKIDVKIDSDSQAD